MRFYGHEKQRQALESHLPPVVLLRGPQSVGKYTLGLWLHEYHRFSSSDLRLVEKLYVEEARDLQRFAVTSPVGRHKLALARLDGASEPALNAMLKTLEEPPPTISFVLTASDSTLDTVMSRAHLVNMGLLADEDVRGVLVQRMGLDPALAARAARRGRGQVGTALKSIEEESAKALVLSVLKALADGDEVLLKKVATSTGIKWDASASSLLNRWVVEAITGQWLVFSPGEDFGLAKERALLRRLLLALSSTARPRLAMYAAMQPLVASRRS